jgi:dolichyl-phosphate-mannose-protein mannosyltransferase
MNTNDTAQTLSKSPTPGLSRDRQIFWGLICLLAFALLLRVVLANVMHGHPTDINNFKAWAMHVARHDFRDFYKSVNPTAGVWCDYPPLYILVLWFVTKFYALFDPAFLHWNKGFFTLLVKMPSILADLGCMALLFHTLKKYIPLSLAFMAAGIFALHPAVFYESAMWGQVDSITLLLQFYALWLMLKEQESLALLVTALNILVKPQGLILLPLLLFITVWKRRWTQLALGCALSLLASFLLTWLFVPANQMIAWFINQYVNQANLYPYSSIQAFNLWSLTGMWQSDVARGIFGIGGSAPAFFWQHKTWGLILFSAAYALSLGFFWKHRPQAGEEGGPVLWHTSSLIMIAFFLFPTRMHERYLFSGLFFLLGSMMLNKRLVWAFSAMSVIFLLNLLFELPGLKRELQFPGLLYTLNDWLAKGWYKPLAILNLLIFAGVCLILFRSPLLVIAEDWKTGAAKIWQRVIALDARTLIPQPVALDWTDFKYILLFVSGSALLKLWRLDFPAEMVFDEVYHARAGGEYALGLHPFEWVHPPLAKLLIALGVLVYDLTAVGWRIMPVIAGSLLLASIYILARFTLPQRWQAVCATLLLACDGVYFVQSRTAMTNIFATFFQVTALAFTWRFFQVYWHRLDSVHRYFSSYLYFTGAVVFIGLALCSRWTSLWAYGFVWGVLTIGVIIPSLLLQRYIQNQHAGARWFSFLPLLLIPTALIVVPAVLYLLSYTQYMSLGHSIKEVIDMQKGIWHYHSQLTDPHPYYSAWYTWPWLVRPTWYYFHNNGNGTLGGIIALGNPAIWWLSLISVAVVIWQGLLRKHLNLWYVAFACLLMYLPWGLSPRTLNFAHYFFEAVPYACLCIAAVLGFIVEKWKALGVKIAYGYMGLACGLFLFFYPIYSALSIPWWYYNLVRWFPSWV